MMDEIMFTVALSCCGIANLLATFLVYKTEKMHRANIEFCKWLIDEVRGK